VQSPNLSLLVLAILLLTAIPIAPAPVGMNHHPAPVGMNHQVLSKSQSSEETKPCDWTSLV